MRPATPTYKNLKTFLLISLSTSIKKLASKGPKFQLCSVPKFQVEFKSFKLVHRLIESREANSEKGLAAGDSDDSSWRYLVDERLIALKLTMKEIEVSVSPGNTK